MTMILDEMAPCSKLTPRQVELVSYMRVTGNLAAFGLQQRIKDWTALKTVMELLGGKWKSAKQAFEFDPDLPLDAMFAEVLERGEVPDPRAAGFFETPEDVADELVQRVNLTEASVVLEPNAGRGAIVRAVLRRKPCGLVLCELLERNRQELVKQNLGYYLREERDFLSIPKGALNVSVVVMNPPFAKSADVDHVTRAIEFLPVGGRLAAVMSNGVKFREEKKYKAFRALLDRHGARIDDLPPGSFKASGTMVNTVIVSLTTREPGRYR